MKTANTPVKLGLPVIVLVVLTVYFPSLSGGVSSVDDGRMLEFLANSEFSWRELFAVGGNLYYRPLLMLTFWFDKFAWDLEPSFMHLENVLLHLGNALLVYAVAAKACAGARSAGQGSRFFPLVCALFFALHPLTTESVNWISGRTDLLATLFALSAFLLLLKAGEAGRVSLALGALALMVGAAISKEVTLFFVPVVVWLVWRWPGEGWGRQGQGRSTVVAVFSLPFLAALLLYLLRRIWKYGADDPTLHYVATNYQYDAINTVRVALKVVGFYAKKLLLPWPLNFAITNVSDYYVLAGIVVVVGVIVLARRRKIWSDLVAAAVCLLLPAVLIALTAVAWTNLAERYLYLPLVLFSIGTVGWTLSGSAGVRGGRYLLPVMMLILIGFGASTVQRNVLWTDPIAFFQDVAAKSPGYAPAHNELALALSKAKRYEEAKQHLAIAQQLLPPYVYPHPFLNEILILLETGNHELARTRLDMLLEDIPGAKTFVLETAAKLNEGLLRKPLAELSKKRTHAQLEAILVELHRRTADPFLGYRLGKMLLVQGKTKEAGRYFAESARDAPATAHYKQAAAKLAAKHSGQTAQ